MKKFTHFTPDPPTLPVIRVVLLHTEEAADLGLCPDTVYIILVVLKKNMSST